MSITTFKSRPLLIAAAIIMAGLGVVLAVGQKAAKAEMACTCATDAQGRTDVRTTCTGVDWSDPLQGNQAIQFAAKCAAATTSKTVYFPKGEYVMDTCAAVTGVTRGVINQAQFQAPAGSPAGTETPGGTFRIVGDGMNDSILIDRQTTNPAYASSCDKDGRFGVFVKFAPGGEGEVRDLALIAESKPGQRPGMYAVYGAGGWVKPDGSIQPTKVSVTGVKAQGWARLFVGSGDTAQSTEFTLDRSELHDIHQGVIIAQDYYDTLPDGTYTRKYTPHQIVRILNSKFDHVGQRCTNQDHGMYIKAPFNELTVEGNTFLNSPGYAVHRYGGFFFTGDPRGVVNVRNNTFRQPDFEADPRARDLCDCKAGEPNCSVGPDGKDSRANIYDSGYIVMDGPGGAHLQDYEVNITGNTFWGGAAISSQMPSTVTNNTFRAYPPLPGDSVPSQFPSTAVVFSQRGPSVFSDNKTDGGVYVYEGADGTIVRNNTCIECSKEFDHGATMLSVRGASGVTIENNVFPAGTGKFTVEPGEYVYENGVYVGRGTDHSTGLKITGNTFTARKGTTFPILTVVPGATGTLTGNTFKMVEGGGPAWSIPSGGAWTVSNNTVVGTAPVSTGPVSCSCQTDAQGRINVKAACPGADWTNPIQWHTAMSYISETCIPEGSTRTVYYPAGTYVVSSCFSGSFRVPDGEKTLTVEGDGIDQTVIMDVSTPGDYNCDVGAHGGTIFRFGAGNTAKVRDLTITEKIEPNGSGSWSTIDVPRDTLAFLQDSPLVRPGQGEVTSKLYLERVKVHHLGRVAIQSGSGGEMYVADSWFSHFRNSLFAQSGDTARPGNPRNVFRATGSHFEHTGKVCSLGYITYLHPPFKEITFENNEAINLHSFGLHIFGPIVQPTCTDCMTVTVRNNKFLQPLAASDPNGVTGCKCVHGQDTNCPADSETRTITNASLYGKASILLDGTNLPYTAIIEGNTFQSPVAISSQNPMTVRNNVFLGSRYDQWIAATLSPAPNSTFENNQIETSVLTGTASPNFIFRNNSCVLSSGACAVNGVKPMTMSLDSNAPTITGNTFQTGAKLTVTGNDAIITGNTMRSAIGDASPLVVVLGNRAVATGNTMSIASRHDIELADASQDSITAPNATTLLPGNSTPVTSRWRNDDGNQVTATYKAAEDTAVSGIAPNAGVRLRFGVANSVGTAEFRRKASLALGNGENIISSAVVDSMNGYAYFGTYTSPGRIVKVRLSDFARVGSVTLHNGENLLKSAVIDAGKGYAYFGTETDPGIVVKIALGAGDSAPTRVGAVALTGDANRLRTAVIDAANGYAYFGASYQVVKIALGSGSNPPTQAGAVVVGPASAFASSGIDLVNGYAYFGTNNNFPGLVSKIALGSGASAPSLIGTLVLNNGEEVLNAGGVDVANGYAYFGTGTNPSKIIKIALGSGANPPTRVGALTLNSGEDVVNAGVIDTVNGLGYFHTWTGGRAHIVKIALGSGAALPTRVGTVDTLLGEEVTASASAFDPATGYVYFGTGTSPAKVVKVSVAPKWRLRLEVAAKTSSCASATGWSRVGPSAAFSMSDSLNLTDSAVTSDSSGLSNGNTSFNIGRVMDTASQTMELALGAAQFTEIEYSIRATSAAVPGISYCFRLTDSGNPSNFTYRSYPEAVIGTARETAVSPGSVSCACPTDSGAAVDVRATCPNVDWTDPLTGNEAIRQAAQCAFASNSRTLYFPAGTYATSVCTAGTLVKPPANIGSLTVVGAGSDKTVIEDRVVSGEAGCSGLVAGGTFLELPAAASGTVRDIALRRAAPGLASSSDAIRAVSASASGTLGRLRVLSAAFENWSRAVVASSGSTVLITNSSFKGNRTAVTGLSGSRLGKIGYNTFELQSPANATDPETVGVSIDQAEGWTIFGNTFISAGSGTGRASGLRVSGPGSGKTKNLFVSVVKNLFRNFRGSGIRADAGASGLQIIGNTFEGDDLGQGSVRIEATAANPNRCIVTRNCFRTPKDTSIAVQGCVVKKNACP